jgi:arylsulfatase A-like enzyme
MEFMREAKVDGRPWCLHLSYIKPHWPYIVPAPYHTMYGAADVMPSVRNDDEKAAPHALYQAFMDERFSKAFSREEVRTRVIPAYMGLIKQIDDQMGVLFSFMEEQGLMDNTMIVFTSDHGDYLGDHWLGEKYLFHDVSARVPLIICDPSDEALGTRGTTSDALVEMIDLAPTFLEFCGGAAKPHILEGRSLLPLLHGTMPASWRKYAISEYDYSMDLARITLDVPIAEARLYMVTDGNWKYIHADGFRPMLFDMLNDPDELVDRGADPSCADIRARLYEALSKWSRTTRTQITVSDTAIQSSDEAFRNYDLNIGPGILIGYWDEAEVEREYAKRAAYRKARGIDV